MTGNNDINLETIVVDNNPDILLKKQIEKQSGEIAAKVKLTKDTFSSLVTNVVSDKIKKVASLLNKQLAAQKKALLEAEARRVQEEAKRGQVAADENAIDLAFQLEEKLSKATEKDVVISTLDRCNAVVTQIDSPRLNMKPQTKSRALIIKRVLAKYCERIGISWKKYKKEETSVKREESDGVSWETLFSGMELSKENVNDNVVSVDQVENDDGFKSITMEEKERRVLISDIGRELSSVREHLNSFDESPSFAKRLKTREDSLLQMLSKVINNDSFVVDKDIDKPIHEEKTEMQMVIEENVGYKPALSEDEYRKVAEELEAYYQDPTVGERMHDLMFKDILFGMNKEEAAEKIDYAERVANVEGLNVGDVKPLSDASDYRKEGETQAQLLFQQSLKEWAKEQAKLLYDKEKNNDLLNGAEEQAGLLYKYNQKVDLLNGADRQADLLYKYNQKVDLLNGADRQADLLYKYNQKVDLLNGADKQAGLLYKYNQKVDLLNGADKQADLLYKYNQKVDLLNGADKQASLLHEQNRLLVGADEQARQLFTGKEQEVSVQPQQIQAQQPQLTPQLQPQMKIESTPESAISQPTTVVTTPTLQPTFNYVISDSYGRYGNQVSAPKPIKIAYGRVSNLRNCGKPKTDLRTNLISLRDQLNSLPSDEVVKEEAVMPKVAA